MRDVVLATLPETGASLIRAGEDESGETMAILVRKDGTKSAPALFLGFLRHPGWELTTAALEDEE